MARCRRRRALFGSERPGGKRGALLSRLTLIVLLLLLPVEGGAQSTDTLKTPRTPWGTPDLRGVWINSTLTPLERPIELGDREFYTKAEVEELQRVSVTQRIESVPEPETGLAVEFSDIWMEAGPLSGRTSLIIGPTGRIPPLTPAGEERKTGGKNGGLTERADSHEDRPWGERCLRFRTGGPPMMAFPFLPFHQIFQTPDHVAFLHEENHEIRIIPLDGRQHVSRGIRLWRGDSRGHWEGDTLVIETTRFNGTGGFSGSGAGLQLTERLQRVDADTVLYEFTVVDPETWTEPWTAEMPLRASPEPLYEHACHEGNYSLPLVLSGARAQEHAARAK